VNGGGHSCELKSEKSEKSVVFYLPYTRACPSCSLPLSLRLKERNTRGKSIRIADHGLHGLYGLGAGELSELPGRRMLLLPRELLAHIDDLIFPADFPAAIACVVIPQLHISATIQFVWEGPPVLGIVKPGNDVALCHGPDLIERYGIGPAQPLELIIKLGFFWCAAVVGDGPESGGFCGRLFGIEAG
jgi:hypothetical protein